MAVFDPKSRYVKPPLDPYEVVDVRGRTVKALPTPEAPVQAAVARHVKKEFQRLDHLANGYLRDPNGYWRIADVNGAVLPDSLAEVVTLLIPAPNRR
jgi:hypothetical protein